jgi:hypothetical protein
MAAVLLLKSLLLSALICECFVSELAICDLHACSSYSVGNLNSLKPLSSQELFLVTPKVIAAPATSSVPSEKNLPILPVPPRQDLPPLYVSIFWFPLLAYSSCCVTLFRPQILNDFLVRLPSEPVTGLQRYSASFNRPSHPLFPPFLLLVFLFYFVTGNSISFLAASTLSFKPLWASRLPSRYRDPRASFCIGLFKKAAPWLDLNEAFLSPPSFSSHRVHPTSVLVVPTLTEGEFCQ